MLVFVVPLLLFTAQGARAAEEPPPPTQVESPDTDNGGGFMAPRPPQQQQAEQPVPSPPADAPSVKRDGDDLVEMSNGGQTRLAHFFTGMEEGEVRPLQISTPQHGSCSVNIDFKGNAVGMTCQR